MLNISYLALCRKSMPTLALEENKGKGSPACLRCSDSDSVPPIRICSYHYLAGTSSGLPIHTHLTASEGRSAGMGVILASHHLTFIWLETTLSRNLCNLRSGPGNNNTTFFALGPCRIQVRSICPNRPLFPLLSFTPPPPHACLCWLGLRASSGVSSSPSSPQHIKGVGGGRP